MRYIRSMEYLNISTLAFLFSLIDGRDGHFDEVKTILETMKGWKGFKTGERLDKKERKKDLIY